MGIREWDNGFLSRPLSAFPAGDCLQAWLFGIETTPAKPTECNVRHAYLAVGDARQFWRNTDRFTVSQEGIVLATCEVSDRICVFDLP